MTAADWTALRALREEVHGLSFVHDAAAASRARLTTLEDEQLGCEAELLVVKKALGLRRGMHRGSGGDSTRSSSDRTPVSRRVVRSRALLKMESSALDAVREQLQRAVERRTRREQSFTQRRNRHIELQRSLARRQQELRERAAQRAATRDATDDKRRAALAMCASADEANAQANELRGKLRGDEALVVERRALTGRQKTAHDEALAKAMAVETRRRWQAARVDEMREEIASRQHATAWAEVISVDRARAEKASRQQRAVDAALGEPERAQSFRRRAEAYAQRARGQNF